MSSRHISPRRPGIGADLSLMGAHGAPIGPPPHSHDPGMLTPNEPSLLELIQQTRVAKRAEDPGELSPMGGGGVKLSPSRHNPTSGLVTVNAPSNAVTSSSPRYPSHLTAMPKPLSVLEVEKDADENFKHKSASLLHQAQSTGHAGIGPLNDWGVSRAEERLAEANRRIRLLQGEAAQLDAMRQQQLMAGEEEILKVKRKLLDDWEAREREWERRKENELRSLKLQEGILREREANLAELERMAEEQLRRAEEDQKRRIDELESDNQRFVIDTEQRLRIELRREMEPQMRSELEAILTRKITSEIREELQLEFMRMCEAMRDEVESARTRMRTELEAELTPAIEQHVFLDCKTRAEQDVHATVLGQLRDANHATQLLKDELSAALDERDRAKTEVATLRQELAALQAQQRKSASEIAALQTQMADYLKLKHQLSTLEAEHALLQQAATGVLQQARSARPPPAAPPQHHHHHHHTPQQLQPQPHMSPEERRVSPRRHHHGPPGHTLPSLSDVSAMLDRGSKLDARPSSMQVWPPRLLPNGGVVC